MNFVDKDFETANAHRSKLDKLSTLFASYTIYPQSAYLPNTPMRVFQSMYPSNHYSTAVDAVLQKQPKLKLRRGADLPWWGESFFTAKPRIMIITQDSLSPDAGSVVFFANLFTTVQDRTQYERYALALGNKNLFHYSSWQKARDTFIRWGLDINSLYITDAAKVYQLQNPQKFDFDLSKTLLEQEISICAPDLLILLGQSPLRLLHPKPPYAQAVDSGHYLTTLGIKTVVAPFPIGNGPTQPRFKERMAGACQLISDAIRQV